MNRHTTTLALAVMTVAVPASLAAYADDARQAAALRVVRLDIGEKFDAARGDYRTYAAAIVIREAMTIRDRLTRQRATETASEPYRGASLRRDNPLDALIAAEDAENAANVMASVAALVTDREYRVLRETIEPAGRKAAGAGDSARRYLDAGARRAVRKLIAVARPDAE